MQTQSLLTLGQRRICKAPFARNDRVRARGAAATDLKTI
jgi:hypothetical protein